MPGKFLDPLDVEYIDGQTWRVTKEFDYRLGSPDGDEYVRVPAGFLTDFASIPRLLWNILPPTGSYGKAAVVHDRLYKTRRVCKPRRMGTSAFLCGSVLCPICGVLRPVTRAEADATLFEAMSVLNVPAATRWVIYLGVRIGGWWAWRQDARKK
jgi:hypothetical protein